MGGMPDDPRVEEAPPARKVEEAEDAEQPPQEDWLEEDLPPERTGEGPDWPRIAVIAGFIALIVAIALFFVWTYLIPAASSSGI